MKAKVRFEAKLNKGASYPCQRKRAACIGEKELISNIKSHLQGTIGGNFGDIENLEVIYDRTENFEGGFYIWIEGECVVSSTHENFGDEEGVWDITQDILQDYVMNMVDGARSISVEDLTITYKSEG